MIVFLTLNSIIDSMLLLDFCLEKELLCMEVIKNFTE